MNRIYEICDRYESGYGHGLARDGLDLSRTPHADKELGEAYQIGYDAGFERSNEPTPQEQSSDPTESATDPRQESPVVVGLEPVVATDHPDIAGGIVWSECELRWINEKLAALQAELAEANDSLTVAYMAGAASKLDEIRGLQDELAECKRDVERLRYLFESSGIEGFVHVELDRYDYALQVADEHGHDEPTVDDDFEGFRRLIDAAMKENM